MGFGVRGSGYGVWVLGCGVWGVGFGVWGLGSGVWRCGKTSAGIEPWFATSTSHSRRGSPPPPRPATASLFWGPGFRQGLVVKAYRRLYHSTLGSRVRQRKKRRRRTGAWSEPARFAGACGQARTPLCQGGAHHLVTTPSGIRREFRPEISAKCRLIRCLSVEQLLVPRKLMDPFAKPAVQILKLRAVRIGTVLDLRTTALHKCAAVPRRARI